MPLSSLAFKGVGRILSPGGRHACLNILMYHRVLVQPDPLQPPDQIDAACFREQMAVLSQWFNVLPLREAVDMLQEGRLPPRALCITFDDGYEDNHSVALPILREFGLQATFFICTGYLGNGLMFNDIVTEAVRRAPGDALDLSWIGLGQRSLTSTQARQALCKELVEFVKYQTLAQRPAICDRLWSICAGAQAYPQLMMSPEQVRDMATQGMTIGGHTHSHPILSKVPLSEATQDLNRNRQVISDITGRMPTLFAYPNGRPGTDFGRDQIKLIQDLGFEAAVSTAWGVATPDQDRYQLPRFAPWNVSGKKLALQLLKNARVGQTPASV